MFRKKQKPVVDERIQKESNKLSAKMFYLLSLLVAVLLVIKIMNRLPFQVYALEVITLVAGIIYLVVAEVQDGIFMIKERDEVLTTLHEDNLAKAMNLEFMLLVMGELLFMFLLKEHFIWLPAYFLVWLPPALIITIASIKNGWIIWGTKKREKKGKKEFKKRVAIGSLFYGVIVGAPRLFKDGAFDPTGILWILGLAAFWGILFYLIMSGMMKVSEKKADSNVKAKENEIEE